MVDGVGEMPMKKERREAAQKRKFPSRHSKMKVWKGSASPIASLEKPEPILVLGVFGA